SAFLASKERTSEWITFNVALKSAERLSDESVSACSNFAFKCSSLSLCLAALALPMSISMKNTYSNIDCLRNFKSSSEEVAGR
ncbi:Hypothetical predicted protein, partial [Olea europaea subsp. europaea]